jgi:hypothetical protein
MLALIGLMPFISMWLTYSPYMLGTVTVGHYLHQSKVSQQSQHHHLTPFQSYPTSAANLNPVTNQVDVDIYDGNDERVDVSGMKTDIEIVIGRMKVKNKEAISVPGELSVIR